jgi:protein phosphatase inhibitor 2
MPKGILKKESQAKKKTIIWDENTIAQHDLERGGRMKISEPKTPFIHYSIETDTLHGTSIDPPPMVLEEAVQKIHIESPNDPQDWSSGDEKEKKEVDFAKKRKLHYNMGEALKRNI